MNGTTEGAGRVGAKTYSSFSARSRIEHLINNGSCNLLPQSNSRWENIPQTLLLNGVLGFILLILFVFMTKIAWKRTTGGSSNDQIDQGLISFLYGYRDPERWYVIPRFEFLRYKDRHHKHEMEYPNIYVPPKLPLASPNELFVSSSALDDDLGAELSSTKSKTLATIKKNLKGGSKSPSAGSTSLPATKTSQVPKSAEKPATSTSTVVNIGKQYLPNNPLDSSFFYPSILTAEQLQASYLSRKLNAFFAMFFRVTDADIIYAKGVDAYEYLLFQRHLILIMFVTNIFCLTIILPIHLFGKQQINSADNQLSFQQSTIKNVDPDSILYWAHIISSICIVVVSIYVLNSYKESTIPKNNSQLARRTLLIGNIPVEQRSRVKLMKIFKDYFPRCKIEAIQFVYKTNLLEQYQLQLSAILVAREYCEYYKQKYNEEIMVKETEVNEAQLCDGYCRFCSFLYICCFNWPHETKQPGTVYYAKAELQYRAKIKEALEKMVKEPSEYAFVTLKTYRQAKRVMEHLSRIRAETLDDSSLLISFNLKKTIPSKSTGPTNSTTAAPWSQIPPASGGSELTGAAVAADNSVDSYESLSASKNIFKSSFKGSKSAKWINDKNAQKSIDDPLNPKNNPRVKSVRSPTMNLTKSIKRQVAASKSAKASNPNGAKDSKQIANPLNGPVAWSARYAPHPDNVEFRDILGLSTTSKYTLALFHLLMFIIFIFFTTPNVILSILERMAVLRPDRAKELTGFHGMFINYVSTLLQVITTAILPSLITLISKQIPYEDTASKNHSMMWKVYAFLILMVIVMPSVGMSSAQAFISSDINPKCLFPTDNGAYYINYVISSVFLTTILELIKPTDIVFYTFLLWTARSFADFEGGRQYIDREFSVGIQHTSVMLIFSVVMTYTISCPLIAPAGLVYLLVKHAVDHYHLFYTYFTKKVDESLQTTIVIFVKISLILMLFQTTVAIYINTGVSYFSLISQIVFCISLAIFSFNCFFECTSNAMIDGKRNRFQREFCACFYLPRVIGDLLRCNAIPESCISRKV